MLIMNDQNASASLLGACTPLHSLDSPLLSCGMRNAASIEHPLDGAVSKLDPVVFTSDRVFARTVSEPDSRIEFVCASGRVPLRPLLSAEALSSLTAARSAARVRQILHAAFPAPCASDFSRLLPYFTDSLVPLFLASDWSPDVARPDPGSLADPATTWLAQNFPGSLPELSIPVPSVLWKGRIYLLHLHDPSSRPLSSSPRPPFQVRLAEQWFIAGESVPVAEIVWQWKVLMAAWFDGVEADIRARAGADSPAVVQARAQLAARGAVEIGDIVLLADPEPMLGHIVPDHVSIPLRRRTGRDLALFIPFAIPVRPYYPTVYQRTSAGSWEPLRLRYGLCLGSSGPPYHKDETGLQTLGYLRKACITIATARAFHVNDFHERIPRV